MKVMDTYDTYDLTHWPIRDMIDPENDSEVAGYR